MLRNANVQPLPVGGYSVADILETTFLPDFFHSKRLQIAGWRKCDERKRNNMFVAWKVRKTHGFDYGKGASH